MAESPESDPDLTAELEFVKSLILEAAEVARSRRERVTPHEKDNLSFVTDLDQDLERLIRERLGARFPDDALTGEEYAAAGGTGPRRWSIDPIDGTGNMVHGLPLWAISIGLLIGGEPVLGVIAVPPHRRAVLGRQGGRRLARRPSPGRSRRRDLPHSGQRLRRHQRPAGRRSAVAPRAAPRPGQRLLRADLRRREPPAGLHLPRRAGPRRRRRGRHRPRGRVPVRHHRRRTSLRRRDGPPHPDHGRRRSSPRPDASRRS